MTDHKDLLTRRTTRAGGAPAWTKSLEPRPPKYPVAAGVPDLAQSPDPRGVVLGLAFSEREMDRLAEHWWTIAGREEPNDDWMFAALQAASHIIANWIGDQAT